MPEFLKLKKSNCKNCYKCIRNCPVKSIRFSGNQAHIVADECILCGQCFVVCPQGAKEIASDTERVKVMIQTGVPVWVSLAPSFVANYDGVGITAMENAIKKLGFSGVEETAIGATIVKREYERRLREGQDLLISSCCHSVNLLIQKYFPSTLPYLADILSPMQAHAMDIRRRHPDVKIVFVGPCVAKKDEAAHYPGIVDAVLTFEELTQWFTAEKITLEDTPDETAGGRARIFPTTGGILKSMNCDLADYTYLSVDGAENVISALRDIEQGNLHHCFIEMSMCPGSCVGGPVMEKYHRSPVRDYASVARYTRIDDFAVKQPTPADLTKPILPISTGSVKPSEAELNEILRRMGKNTPDQELNCGSCGYNTCREKAAAIYAGKADVSMCLPFLMARAENFSDTIINNTPNGILVLNEELEVQQINRAALRMMNIRADSDVLGEPVIRIMDPRDFLDVKRGSAIHDRRVYLAEYNRYVDETIIYEREYHILMCILRDVTDEQTERDKKESISRKTVEIADNVVEKQMRVVQEIASLLGETAAETKIALTKLKESINDE